MIILISILRSFDCYLTHRAINSWIYPQKLLILPSKIWRWSIEFSSLNLHFSEGRFSMILITSDDMHIIRKSVEWRSTNPLACSLGVPGKSSKSGYKLENMKLLYMIEWCFNIYRADLLLITHYLLPYC